MNTAAHAQDRRQLASLPSVDRLLGLPAVAPLIAEHGRECVLKSIRRLLDQARASVLEGKSGVEFWDEAAMPAKLAGDLAETTRARLTPVFNLTGTVLHTNLGR